MRFWIWSCAVLRFACVALIVATSEATAEPLTLEESFRPPRFVEPRPASRLLLLADGRFMRFWTADTIVGDLTAGPITRYFSDGTLDNSFRFRGG